VIEASQLGPLAYVLAFGTGLLSFLSPCVLPLVPAYLGYLSGVAGTGDSPSASPDRPKTVAHAAAFVSGFGLLFVLLGAGVGLASWGAERFFGAAPGGVRLGGGMIALTLTRVGGVLIAVLAARLLGGRLSGTWSWGRLRWPDPWRGRDQHGPRWSLVALLCALGTVGVGVIGLGGGGGMGAALSSAGRSGLLLPLLLDGLTVGLAVLVGWQLGPRAAIVLGGFVAAANTSAQVLRWSAAAGGPWSVGEAVAVAVQVMLIMIVVGVAGSGTRVLGTWRPGGRLARRGSYAASAVTGAVFCAGWTPCVGPNLLAITAIAGASGTVGQGALLLALYALGLGLPFLAAGFAWGSAAQWARAAAPWFPALRGLNFALLTGVAALILTGRLQTLAAAPTLIDAEALLESWFGGSR
jgi:cytochrome c-type biogenesis protein